VAYTTASVTADKTELKVTGLTKCKTYKFQIRAMTCCGPAKYWYKVTVPLYAPPAKIEAFCPTRDCKTDIVEWDWKEPEAGCANQKITQYECQIKNDDPDDEEGW